MDTHSVSRLHRSRWIAGQAGAGSPGRRGGIWARPLTVGLDRRVDGRRLRGQLAGCGAARFLAVTGEEFAQSRYCDRCRRRRSARARGRRHHCHRPGRPRAPIARCPAWRYRLGGAIDTHVTGRSPNGPSVTRWFYRQRMEARAHPHARGRGSCCSKPAAMRAWSGAAGRGTGRELSPVAAAALAHHGHRRSRAASRRADHPARRQAAVRRRRRLDQEAGRRPDASAAKPKS